jgi:hypothetical protein
MSSAANVTAHGAGGIRTEPGNGTSDLPCESAAKCSNSSAIISSQQGTGRLAEAFQIPVPEIGTEMAGDRRLPGTTVRFSLWTKRMHPAACSPCFPPRRTRHTDD